MTIQPAAAAVFANYSPHGLAADAATTTEEMDYKTLALWTKYRIKADPFLTKQEAQNASKATYAEVGMLLAIGWMLADRADLERDIYSFTDLHPPKVIQQFTVAGLQAAFDSEEVRGAWSTRDANVGMPKDLLSLISEYAPVDLPSLPLPALVSLFGSPFDAHSAPSFFEDEVASEVEQ